MLRVNSRTLATSRRTIKRKPSFDEAGRYLAGAQQHVENQITGRRPQVESINCPNHPLAALASAW